MSQISLSNLSSLAKKISAIVCCVFILIAGYKGKSFLVFATPTFVVIFVAYCFFNLLDALSLSNRRLEYGADCSIDQVVRDFREWLVKCLGGVYFLPKILPNPRHLKEVLIRGGVCEVVAEKGTFGDVYVLFLKTSRFYPILLLALIFGGIFFVSQKTFHSPLLSVLFGNWFMHGLLDVVMVGFIAQSVILISLFLIKLLVRS